MAKTKFVTVKGKAYWARVFEDNRDMTGYKPDPSEPGTFEECDGAYTVDVYLEPKEADKLKKAGSALKGSVDEHGFKVRLKRKHTVKDRHGNVLDWAGGPPVVLKEDGSKWDYDTDGTIGNESEAEFKVSVYPTKFANGTRLEAMKVTNHVPYEMEELDEMPF